MACRVCGACVQHLQHMLTAYAARRYHALAAEERLPGTKWNAASKCHFVKCNRWRPVIHRL